MYGLQDIFGEQVDFINLDVDNREIRDLRLQLGMRNRSHYVLIDAEQNVVKQWFGPLEKAQMVTELEGALASIGTE